MMDGGSFERYRCRRFVAHRHCQFALSNFFSGILPSTSPAHIPRDAPLSAIFVYFISLGYYSAFFDSDDVAKLAFGQSEDDAEVDGDAEYDADYFSEIPQRYSRRSSPSRGTTSFGNWESADLGRAISLISAILQVWHLLQAGRASTTGRCGRSDQVDPRLFL